MWRALKSLSSSGESLCVWLWWGSSNELQHVREHAGVNGLCGIFHFACEAETEAAWHPATAFWGFAMLCTLC